MSRMAQSAPVGSQGFPSDVGNSTQHGRDRKLHQKATKRLSRGAYLLRALYIPGAFTNVLSQRFPRFSQHPNLTLQGKQADKLLPPTASDSIQQRLMTLAFKPRSVGRLGFEVS